VTGKITNRRRIVRGNCLTQFHLRIGLINLQTIIIAQVTSPGREGQVHPEKAVETEVLMVAMITGV